MESQICSNDSTSDMGSANTLLLSDIYPVLQVFASSMGKLRFDAARERIETFRGKRNCTSSNSEDSTCHFLLQTAIQISILERTYFTLNFMLPRAFYRKDNTTLSSYACLKSDLCRQIDSNINCLIWPAEDICQRFVQIINARISLMNMYDGLTVQSLTSPNELVNLVQLLSSIMQSFLPIQKQECLFLLIDNIICEVGIVQLLFETQIALINCEYLLSLLHLKSVNAKVRQWFLALDYSKSRSKSTSFFKLPSSIRPSSTLHLCEWIEKFYFLLLSKYSLYFRSVLSPHCKQLEVDTAFTALKEPNFVQAFMNFLRRSSPLFISLIVYRTSTDLCSSSNVLLAENDDSEECGELKKKFILLVIFGERKIFYSFLPSISILIQQCAESKLESDKIKYCFDHLLCRSIFVTLIEHNIFMAITFAKKVSEKDNAVIHFIAENSALLRCGKICQLLRGGSK
ncbi:unnamed protein product [Dracunculus medinensis]|uniref:Uncharacterized protein n=1 Tax=Dracunculus medinensis TaxID=318479 RepID=A0A0N4UDG9_DRAME|nr:unnamed protein product [Dracunculus medinensis]